MTDVNYFLFGDSSCYSSNANAYQKINLVLKFFHGKVWVPNKMIDWVPEDFKTNSNICTYRCPLFFLQYHFLCPVIICIAALFHVKRTSIVAMSPSSEISFFSVILLALFKRCHLVLFSWDPPGIMVRDSGRLVARLRCKLLDKLHAWAILCSDSEILNLHIGFTDVYKSRTVRKKIFSFPNGTEVQRNQQVLNGIVHVSGRIAINSAFVTHKGCWELARLLVRLWKNNHRVSIVWIGFGNEQNAVLKYLHDSGIPSSNIISPGRVSCSEALSFLATADFAVNAYHDIPSLRWNYVLKAPEFLSLGLPVVSVALPGVMEYVRDGENGLLFPPGNWDDAFDKIQYLLSKPQEIVQMRKNALRTAVCYDWSRINTRIVKKILNLIPNAG